MRKFSFSTIALLCMSLMTATFATEAHAQRGKKSKKKGQTEAPKGRPDKDAIKSIDEVVKNCATLDGLFTLYTDTVKGSSYLAIPDSMTEREFIYFSHVDDGVAESGYTRGSYRNSKVISSTSTSTASNCTLRTPITISTRTRRWPKPRVPTSTRPSWRA